MAETTGKYLVGSRSLNAALDLLRERSSKTGKRKRNDDTAEDKSRGDKVAQLCTGYRRTGPFPINKEKTNAALGFYENHALTEMRLCLARHDWAGLRQLFPLILRCYGELLPIVWRYILTILLCSPHRDGSHLRQLIEMGIGARAFDKTNLLERFFTIQYD